jgi:hypothetical protein
VSTAVLVVLLGVKLHAYLGSPVGQWLRNTGIAGVELEPQAQRVAVGLVRALERLGIETSAIERQQVPSIIDGRPATERWTIAVPERVALVECNLAVTQAGGRLGLEVEDAWEHRFDPRGHAGHGGGAKVDPGGATYPALTVALGPRAADRLAGDGTGGGPMAAHPAGVQSRPGASSQVAGGRDAAAGRQYRLTFVRFPPPYRGRLALVIDDFGSSWSATARAFLEFGKPLNIAVLPGLRSSRRIAEAARAHGHEVLLHLPMEPEDFPRSDPGRDAVLVEHRPAEVKAIMRRALASVGRVSGISNHMGSLATADQELMRVVLDETDRQGLYFFDSRTTPRSVVAEVARKCGTPAASNRLFIDNDRSPDAIRERLEEAMEIALETGSVAVIGHPYRETLEVLTETLPELERQDVHLVQLSELVSRPLTD